MNKLIDTKGLKRAIENIKSFINKNYITEVTYGELVELRNNNNLIPGKQYRIIDYITTTVQENTRSAGHQFDIIVTALNDNTLSEMASAIKHKGDTYFTNANLSAWQIWYNIDNDVNKFAWADEENGKGVIYRMIDEWNNDCPYDFKNILFIRYKLEAPEYEGEGYLQQLTENVKTQFLAGQLSYIWAGLSSDNKLWEDDYAEVFSVTTGETMDFYTFSSVDNSVVTDVSLGGNSYNNKMGYRKNNDLYYLPNNVFFGNICTENSLDHSCYNNSFGNGCNRNNFSNYCHNNCFGDSCSNNHLGNHCYGNSLGNYCTGNNLSYDCYFNSFGGSCSYNKFANGCYTNSVGNDFNDNSFSNYCYNNSFGDDCEYNSFGNVCLGNTFGNNCKYNSFGNGCQGTEFGNNCYGNSLGNECVDNEFGNNCNYNRLYEQCQNNFFITNDQFIKMGIGCYENTVIEDIDRGATFLNNIQGYSLVNNEVFVGMRNGEAVEFTLDDILS